MNNSWMSTRSLALGILTAGLLLLTAPSSASAAAADWIPVEGVTDARIFSLSATGDTLTAGADSVVFVSIDAGGSWHRSERPVASPHAITATLIRNGRLYAATAGKGVFISDDLGASWRAFNEGLVGGFQDSQLDVSDLAVRGDSLYAGTGGAGVYVRRFTGVSAWQPFGAIFEPAQAPNVNGLAVGGTRLLALAGNNGTVFHREPGEPEWTESLLENNRIRSGLSAKTAAWTGTGWAVGTNIGVYRSTAGQEPWTRFDPGLGAMDWTALATQSGRLYAAFDIPNAAVIEDSDDGGATWHMTDVFANVFVLDLMAHGNSLYAARLDGLWERPIAPIVASVGGSPTGVRFVLAGPQPSADEAPVRFELREPGTVTIELLDVSGRLVGERLSSQWAAGPHDLSLDTHALAPGVYSARLTAGEAHAVVRIVHVR